MNNEFSPDFIEALKSYRLPLYNEIPNVGLYLEQTTKFINESLKLDDNFLITNSMISNYVKHKIIANPIKKQYSRDQIAQLIFITLTKSAISLDNVKLLFSLLDENHTIEEEYNFFHKLFEAELHNVFGLNNEAELIFDTNEKRLVQRIVLTAVNKAYIDESFKEM